MEKVDNLTLSNFNSNSENISSSSKKHTVFINSFNSTSELISSSTKSSNEFMSRETLVDKLEQPPNVFCTGKYGKYNINTSQKFTDTVQKFNSHLSKFLNSVGVVSTCNKYYVATYRSNAPFISDIEKKDLIKNVFVPDDNFSFPETNRSFKSEWFTWFPWLCYSPSEDAIYCLACVLLGHKLSEKATRVKNVYSYLLDIGKQQSQPVKYMLKGRKKERKC